MADEGNRICLDATPGNEHIDVCDQHGNEVILHASKKLIKIFAPYKCSGIELGNTSFGPDYGVYIYTDGKYKLKAKEQFYKEIDGHSETIVTGHYRTTVDGHYRTMVGGYYTTLVGGFYTGVTGGAYTSVTGGLYTGVALGVKLESCMGFKLEANACEKVNLTSDTDKRKAEQIRDTAKTFWLAQSGAIAALYAKERIYISSDIVDIGGKMVNINNNVFKVKQ